MIHNVELSQDTKMHLSEVLQLQLDLLRFTVEPEAQLDVESLGNYLNRFLRYNGRGSDIASYIVGTRNRQGKFGRLLQSVIDGQQGAEVWDEEVRGERLLTEKRRVIDNMYLDILNLALCKIDQTFCFYMLNNTIPAEFVAANYHIEQSAERIKYPDWLQAIRSFLQEFYSSLDAGLSASLFQDGHKYGRQEYFWEFTNHNKGQYVCAICDETSFRTITQKPDQTSHFHSDIEHYFPKSIYPHLSCHPYNLIPICKFCNQALHGDKDPLAGKNHSRRNLGDLFLPYRQEALAEYGSLKITWDNDDQPSLQLVNRPGSADLRLKLQALSDIYSIPERWQYKRDEIGDHLWRRIRNFWADDIEIADAFDSTDHIQRKLNRLLAYMHDDLGRDPLSFPALWWLASLIELELQSDTESPFLSEIQGWIQHDRDRKSELEATAQDLRRVAAEIYQSSA